MTVVRRRRDWVQRLETEIVKASVRRFRFGRHDCLRFPARCIRAMTGVNPAASYGDVKTRAAVEKELKRGLARIVGDEMKRHGFPEIPPLKAGRGDAVIIKTPGGLAGGIVALDGRSVFAAKKPAGIVDIPLTLEFVKRAWRVG